MLKRLSIIFTLILTLTLTAAKSMAADNYLNSVLLEGTDNGYNVVLRSDGITKVKKEIQSSDKITLTLKGILPSANITTLYKDTADVNNLIVENSKNNELKIHIQAHNISKANIIFDTPNSAPIPVGDTFAPEKTLWSIVSVAILLLVMKSTKSIQTTSSTSEIMNRDIREREMEMYRNFKRELASMPSINYKVNNNSYVTNTVRRRNETIRNFEHYTKI